MTSYMFFIRFSLCVDAGVGFGGDQMTTCVILEVKVGPFDNLGLEI